MVMVMTLTVSQAQTSYARSMEPRGVENMVGVWSRNHLRTLMTLMLSGGAEGETKVKEGLRPQIYPPFLLLFFYAKFMELCAYASTD